MLTRPIPAARQEVRDGPVMMVATESFSAMVDGELVRIEAARGTSYSRYAADHELVLRFPERFKPHRHEAATAGQNATPKPKLRRSTSATRAPDTLPRAAWALGPLPDLPIGRDEEHDPELRDTASPVKVTFSEHVHDQIAAAIRATPSGYETGGLLIGRHDRGDRVHILEAWGPGPLAERSRNSLHLDYNAQLKRAHEMCRAHDNYVIAAGMWHTHPQGAPRPSSDDLAVFGELLERASTIVFPIKRFVAVIASQPQRDYPPPPAVWVVRRVPRPADRERLVCERAEAKL